MNTDDIRKQTSEKEAPPHPNPDKVHTELLDKSSFFDANDSIQMKYEMLRSVSVERQSVADAAQRFGFSRVAFYHARKQYKNHGLLGLLPRRRGPRKPHKFTTEVMSYIEEQLTTNGRRPNWNLLSEQIADRFGINTHPRSVERAAKLKTMVDYGNSK